MEHKTHYKQVVIASYIVLATFSSPMGFADDNITEECKAGSSNTLDRLWELVQSGSRTLASEVLCQKQYELLQYYITADNIYLQTELTDNNFRIYVTTNSSPDLKSIAPQSLTPTEATFTIIENKTDSPIIDTVPGYKSSK